MDADDKRAVAWRDAVCDELRSSGMTRRKLSAAVSVSPQRMSQWLGETRLYSPPDPDVVFAIEDALGVPNRLAHLLGYVRFNPDGVNSVEHAVRMDKGLGRAQRDALIRFYYSLSGDIESP